MRLCYVLLSPTWGMHQYTADLANRQQAVGTDVHVLTTRYAPREQYGPGVVVHRPVGTRDRGFSLDPVRPRGLLDLLRALGALEPDLVHVTGPHLWNPLLLALLRRSGVPTVHTLHDLHPHPGESYGRLLYVWNASVRRLADHLLVHGVCHRDELQRQGVAPDALTCTPLTHLFVSFASQSRLAKEPPEVEYEPWALFFGRLEPYKGLDALIEAARRLGDRRLRVVIAGPGRAETLGRGPLPSNVQVHAGLVGDEVAIDLFRRCGLLVLPYVEASQSALVAAAYYFRKPVIVTRVGALAESVAGGRTGWVIPPGNVDSLAGALEAGLRDPARLARMGQAARSWYDLQREAEGIALQEMYTRRARRSG